MIHWSFWALVFCLISQFDGAEASRKISVMLSKEWQIEDRKNHALQRLDFQIIENFAKQFKFEIEYITVNETLNDVFSTEDGFVEFLHSIEHS